MIKNKIFILFLVAFVALSELMLSIDSIATFFLYFVLILFFLFSFSKAGPLNSEGVLASIFLVLPIIRIIQLFLQIDFFWNNLILYLCFLYLAFVCIIKFDIKPGFTNYKGYYIIFSMILGIAFGIFANNVFILTKFTSFIYILPLVVFTEELFFRGVLQNYVESKYGRVIGIIFVSLVYGILSINQGLMQALLLFSFYLIGSIFYTETKNVYVTVGYSLMFHLFYFIIVL